ncbi:MAG: SpoIID/LytB domain-containing protein [Thermoleophilia bacterium]
MSRTVPTIIAVTVAAAGLAAGVTLAGGQAPPPATTAPQGNAAATFTFTGRGWGHGVGMSQYGARGRARAGWSTARILAAYYPGTRLSTARQRTVRILLASGRRAVAVRGAGAWRAVGGGRTVALRPGATYRMVSAGAAVELRRGARRVMRVAGPIGVRAVASGGVVSWGGGAGRAYRGVVSAVPRGGSLDVVNSVRLDDYLLGVVPREMPADWGDDAPAALRAQAIAARSYAIATMTPGAAYDVFDDDRSQVYGGRSAEDPRTTRAVRSTRGTVLTYDGAVITAFFFSTSGGRTEDVQNVFPGAAPRPYLVSVPDPFDHISPYHVWTPPPSFTGARLGRLLGLGGPVAEVRILSRGRSPRVREALVITDSGRQVRFTGARLRSALGLRDTWFSVTKTGGTPVAPAPVAE